jgi:Na+/melibiose symporter-like transporter
VYGGGTAEEPLRSTVPDGTPVRTPTAPAATGTAAPAADRARPTLRGTGFGRLWTSTGAANLGDGVLFAGLPVLATTITTSPTAVSGVMVALMLPMVLSALPSGALADRADRRRILLAGNAVRAAALLALAVVAVVVDVRLAVVYAAALVAASSEMLVDTTAQAAVPGLVPDARLDGANARLMVTQRVGNDAVGAPIGAALAGAGALALFVPSAALYALAGCAALRLRLRHPRAAAAPPAADASVVRAVGAEVRAGITYLRGHTLLRRLAVAAALTNLGNTAFGAVAVLYVIGPLDLPASSYGLLLVALAAGGLLGGAVAEPVLVRTGPAAGIRGGFAGSIVAYLALVLADHAAAAAAALVLLGATSMVINVAARTLRQRLVPDAMLGRVSASMAALSLVATPFGALLGGLVAEWIGVRAAAGTALVTNLGGLALLAPLTATAVAAARTRKDRT